MSGILLSHFYDNYYGHTVDDLRQLAAHFASRDVLFLAGDSSLDNKHWFRDTAPAVNGYEGVLRGGRSKTDIAYHMNSELQLRGLSSQFVVINAAVEEASIGSKACGRLNAQDKWVRDNIRPEDTLVVSLGGNDVALAPSPCTVASALVITRCTPKVCLRNACGAPLPCDDPCCGCCCGCLSNLLAFPAGYGYFLHLYETRLLSYIKRLVSRTKPKRVLVCMIYYPDEKMTGSWADPVLGGIGYNKDPGVLQTLIRSVYLSKRRRLRVPGTEVVHVPLFLPLDGTRSEDYCQRVEPSGGSGGRRMAQQLVDAALTGSAAVDRHFDVRYGGGRNGV